MNVQVRLRARQYVDKVIREEGDIVTLPKSIAESFGDIVPDEKPEKADDEKKENTGGKK